VAGIPATAPDARSNKTRESDFFMVNLPSGFCGTATATSQPISWICKRPADLLIIIRNVDHIQLFTSINTENFSENKGYVLIIKALQRKELGRYRLSPWQSGRLAPAYCGHSVMLGWRASSLPYLSFMLDHQFRSNGRFNQCPRSGAAGRFC
jgi:hypothetical protein